MGEATAPFRPRIPVPVHASRSINAHLLLGLGCKASSSRHHLGLASWTQAHKHHRSTGRNKVGVGRVRGGKSISRPTCPPVLVGLPGCLFACVCLFCAASSRPASPLSPSLPSTHLQRLLGRLVSQSQADPGVVPNSHLHPRPRSSSYHPTTRKRHASTHALGPTHSHSSPIQSNPIQSSPASPVLSSKSPFRPVKVHHRHSPRTGLPGADPPLCFLPRLWLAARRSPALPDLAPGVLYLIRLCSCLLHPPFLSHRSAASVSVLCCKLLSSLFPYLHLQTCNPASPGRLLSCSLPPLPPIFPSHSLAAATLLLSRIDNTGLPTTQPVQIHRHLRFSLPDQTSQPCQTFYDLSAAFSSSRGAIARSWSCLVIRQDKASQRLLQAQGTTPAGIHLAGNLTD